MSYALAFNDRSLGQLRALEPWLQEDVLDELDRLAANPSVLVYRAASTGAVSEFHPPPRPARTLHLHHD